jgi:hypothetical protein
MDPSCTRPSPVVAEAIGLPVLAGQGTPGPASCPRALANWPFQQPVRPPVGLVGLCAVPNRPTPPARISSQGDRAAAVLRNESGTFDRVLGWSFGAPRGQHLRGNANLKGINMRVRFGKASDLLVWIPGLALGLFCATGVATHLGWIPTSIGLGDRPAVRTLRAPPHRRTGPAMPVAHAVRIDLPSVLCTECGVKGLRKPTGTMGTRDGAVGTFWLGQARAATAEALTPGKDRLAALIAWHVCARTGSGCD